MSYIARRVSPVLCLALLLTGNPAAAGAQALAPKRVLTTGAAPGCELAATGQGVIARRDNVEARRLAAAGQEAALIGDQAGARDAFARAAALNPGDERVAYDLARANEELADSAKAVTEFCRYLTLSPAGREAADVRDRLTRLVPQPAQRRAQDVQVAFRLGLAHYDDARFDASARAFDDVVRLAPTSPEGYFNRGLSLAAGGKRAAALTDLEQYRAAAPTVDDRVEVGRAIEVLRRPVFSPGMALVRGVLPGLGQVYTARPGRGVALLVAAAGAASAGFVQRTTEVRHAYVDPNGVPAPYSETTTARPYFGTAMAAALGLTIAGAVEAALFARRSHQGATITAPTSPGRATPPGTAGFAILPSLNERGDPTLRFSARF